MPDDFPDFEVVTIDDIKRVKIEKKLMLPTEALQKINSRLL